jgi:type 1 glutamine amidotransferase
MMAAVMVLVVAEGMVKAAAEKDPAEAVAKTEFSAAKPAQPRKVLIYSHCNGFNHGGAIEAAKIAFPAIGKKTGAFECVISDDLAYFEADKIQQFDAIIFSNTTGDLFTGKAFDKCAPRPAKEDEPKTTERLRKNLVDFVRGGRGIMGVHSAADCSYGWREWGEMLGGYFIGHPWGTIWVTNDDPESPINAAFRGQGFQISDEIYTYGPSRALKWDAYGRDVNRVLLSVDMGKSKIEKGPRADNDHGLSWIKTYGQGRTFYSAFGHDQRAFVNPAVLQHFLAGLQFALGDLKADAAPRSKPATPSATK